WPGLSCRMVTLVTEGDKTLDRPLPEIGGKGLFTAELENALRSGEIDLAVHSLKDLPVDSSPGLCIGAISKRADARDVFISANYQSLATLPNKARVGTSSLRREAQIKAARPDLEVLPLRGNVDTRIRKAMQGDYEAIILAAAGLERLDLGRNVTEFRPFEVMLPAPGQGALAVQCRAEDVELIQLLRAVHHPATDQAVTAERAFLAALGGGCSAPVAAYANPNGALLEMTGLVASVDGQRVVRVSAVDESPTALGKRLAHQALDQGAGDLLK
ncbi:MAG: hydroxymethylbilane synthase, partial [Chloroflexi bacterium]